MRELRSINFEHLAIFVAVAESGSLSAAAERQRVGKTAVTKAIQRLESELGEALIARTTRRLSGPLGWRPPVCP